MRCGFGVVGADIRGYPRTYLPLCRPLKIALNRPLPPYNGLYIFIGLISFFYNRIRQLNYEVQYHYNQKYIHEDKI